MECLCCGGKLVRERASYCVTYQGYHLILDHMPAWACEQCGEPLFDENSVDAIKKEFQGVDTHLETSSLWKAPA